jgi:hypothetical protein
MSNHADSKNNSDEHESFFVKKLCEHPKKNVNSCPQNDVKVIGEELSDVVAVRVRYILYPVGISLYAGFLIGLFLAHNSNVSGRTSCPDSAHRINNRHWWPMTSPSSTPSYDPSGRKPPLRIDMAALSAPGEAFSPVVSGVGGVPSKGGFGKCAGI